jgi:hypothetical protein
MMKSVLKNGGLGFALLMALSCMALLLILRFVFPDNNPYQVYRLASVALSGLLLAMAIRHYKSKIATDSFSLSTAFLAGAVPTILGTFVIAALVYSFLSLSPDSLQAFKTEMIPSKEQADSLQLDYQQILTDIGKLSSWDMARAEITQKLLSLFFVNILAAAYFRS